MKYKTDRVLFIFYPLSFFSHNQYGGKTYPFWVGFIFFIFFLKKVLTFSKICYILYISNHEREVKTNLKNENRKTQRCFFMTKEEDLMLQKDAYKHEMNTSAYLRWLIKQEHEKKEGKI